MTHLCPPWQASWLYVHILLVEQSDLREGMPMLPILHWLALQRPGTSLIVVTGVRPAAEIFNLPGGPALAAPVSES